jgi:hypothetical protein
MANTWRPTSPAIALARFFCLFVGASLLLTTLAALALTNADFSFGDDLPHESWNFLFAFNGWHHLLHVVTATVLLVTATRRAWGPFGALIFGLNYAVMAPAGFLDGDDVFNTFYSGTGENIVHAALAVSGVTIGGLGLRALHQERRKLAI